MKKVQSQQGVTLIELMVTIAILAVIASIAIPAYSGYIITARKSECLNEVAAIQLAEEEFYLENNSYYAGTRDATPTNTLQSASSGFYKGTYATGDNCQYDVAACASGTIASCYTLTVTGINDLASPAWSQTFTKD